MSWLIAKIHLVCTYTDARVTYTWFYTTIPHFGQPCLVMIPRLFRMQQNSPKLGKTRTTRKK